MAIFLHLHCILAVHKYAGHIDILLLCKYLLIPPLYQIKLQLHINLYCQSYNLEWLFILPKWLL